MNPQQLIQMLMSGANPQQMVQQIARQNPQANAMLNQMHQSGMTPQEFTMQYARQHGINLEPLLQQLKQRGVKF